MTLAPITRRCLAALTGRTLAAVALPGGASAAPQPETPPSEPAGSPAPDAELFRRLDALARARERAWAAGTRADDLRELSNSREPPRPAALYVAGPDALNCGAAPTTLPDGRWGRVYDLNAIDELRNRPPYGVPKLDARRAEVLAVHDAWMAECDATWKRLGGEEVGEEESRAALEAFDRADDALPTAPATFAGLAAKARAAADIGSEEWARRIVVDVLALAQRQGSAP